MPRNLPSRLLAWIAAASLALPCLAQTAPAPNYLNNPATSTTFGTVSGVGALPGIVLFGQNLPNYSTIDWSNDGKAASVCTYVVLGSSDGKHWHSLLGTLSCSTNGSQLLPAGSFGDMQHIDGKVTPYVMIYVTAYTAGDVTTAVVFRFTRGGSGA